MNRAILVSFLIAATIVGGCGRRGALEDPSVKPAPAPAGALIGTVGMEQPPTEPPKPADRPFFLDFLI